METSLCLPMTLVKLFVKWEMRNRPRWDNFDHVQYTAEILDTIADDDVISDSRKFLLARISVWMYRLLDNRYGVDHALLDRISDLLQIAFPSLGVEGVAHIVAFLYVLNNGWKRPLATDCMTVLRLVQDADRIARMGEYGYNRASSIVEDILIKLGAPHDADVVDRHLLKYLDKNFVHLYQSLATPLAQSVAIGYDQRGISMYLTLRERVTGNSQPGINQVHQFGSYDQARIESRINSTQYC